MRRVLSYAKIQELRNRYDAGENILTHLRNDSGNTNNTAEMILYSYDLQAGTYSAAAFDSDKAILKRRAAAKLRGLIDDLGGGRVLEAGVGEATTLAEVVAAESRYELEPFGFDISFSRLLYARARMIERTNSSGQLFVAELENIPLPENAVDVVYTFHSIEPNRGNEEALLAELFRVSRGFVVLVEPSYELGSAATRAHIEDHRYCWGLSEIVTRLGHEVICHELFGIDSNPENEAALLVAKVTPQGPALATGAGFVSPVSRKPLREIDGSLYCAEDGYAFPVITGIPCLLPANAVLASKLGEFF